MKEEKEDLLVVQVIQVSLENLADLGKKENEERKESV